jgi:hypothetical protein
MLSIYYNKTENYQLMIKYYLMAISYSNSFAMTRLAIHYENMIKYYEIAINFQMKKQ